MVAKGLRCSSWVVVALFGAAALLSGCGSDNTVSVGDTNGPWRVIGASPLSPRTGATALWSGGEVVVYGGYDPGADEAATTTETVTGPATALAATTVVGSTAPGPPPSKPAPTRPAGVKIDGAAYDPSTGVWRMLPAAPVPDGFSPRSITADGGRVTVSFGRGSGCAVDDPVPDPAGAWYDASSDTWSTFPPSPIPLICTPAGAWSEGKLWMFEGQHGAVYDPVSGTWESVASPPRAGSLSIATIHPLGDELVALGTVPGGGPEELAPAFVAFDLTSRTWADLPLPPLEVSGPSVIAGDRLYVFDPQRSAAASWDQTTREWTALPDAPIGTRIGNATVAAGDRLVVWGGVEAPRRAGPPSAMLAVQPGPPLSDGAAYDPATGTWSLLANAPIPGRMDAAAVGAADQVFAWGGQLIEPTDTGNHSVARGDGALLTPTPTNEANATTTSSHPATTTSSPAGVTPPSSTASGGIAPNDTAPSSASDEPCGSVTTTTLAGRPAPPDTAEPCLDVTSRMTPPPSP